MNGSEKSCPKCGLEFRTLLHPLCQHEECPSRELARSQDPGFSALDVWRRDGGPRPRHRFDGWPTRADTQWWTPAEQAIARALEAVERVGASPALTAAVILLAQARDRVADHVERSA